MAKKAAAKKSAPKKTASKKGAAKKAPAKKATAKKAAVKKAPAKKTPAKKAAAKKAPAKKATAKKAAAKKAPAKKATAKKAAAKKAPAKKAPAKKAAPVKTESERVEEAQAAAAVRMKEYQKTSTKAFKKPFVKKQKEVLLAEREKYTRSAVSYREEADSLVLNREPGDVQFDEESGEGDTLAVERERDLALSAQAQQAVDQIDEALKRIDDGVYGVCSESGKPIPKERLEAIPWASQRVEFKVGGLGRR